MDRSIAETLGLSQAGMVAVLVAAALILAVVTWLVARRRARQAAAAVPPAQAAPQAPAPAGQPIAAQCRLTGCDEATAALIIAIVAHNLGDDFQGKQVTSIRQL